MPDAEVIQGQVARLLAEKLNLQVQGSDTDLIETGILDSLTFVGLLHELELMYQIQFSLDDLDIDRFRSIRRIAEFLSQHAARNNVHAG